YTSPVYTPDGRTIVALRSSNYVRMHAYMEYGALRQAQLIRIPATGAAATVIATARMGGKPQFTRDAGYVYLNFDDGLNRVDVGADFFDWAEGGRTITWAVGSTFYRRPLSGVRLDEPTSSPSAADVPRRGERGLRQFAAIVEVPRDLPRGTLVLRGGTAITMK